MKVTLGQASKMTGKAKSTISQAIKDGTISASRSGKSSTSPLQIEVSELLRVFPAKRALVVEQSNTSSNTTGHQPEQALDTSSNTNEHSRTPNQDALELAVLRERDKHYEQRIKDLQDQLTEAKERADDYRQRFLEADTKLLGVLQTVTSSNDTHNSYQATEHSEHFTEQSSNTAEHPTEHPSTPKLEPLILSSEQRIHPEPEPKPETPPVSVVSGQVTGTIAEPKLEVFNAALGNSSDQKEVVNNVAVVPTLQEPSSELPKKVSRLRAIIETLGKPLK